MMCDWGHGWCTAPETNCPHWIGTFCELDEAFYNSENVPEHIGKRTRGNLKGDDK